MPSSAELPQRQVAPRTPPPYGRQRAAGGDRGRSLQHDTLCTRMRNCRRPVGRRLRVMDTELGFPAERPHGPANVSLTIESDPPGADAKTSIGPSCRTPCMIPVPADREFTVNYSLNGYLPQIVPVSPR